MRHLHVTTGLFGRTLRSEPEDTITEVLAALLRSEATGLQVLQALLPDKNTLPEQVSTQYRGADGSRPDLVLHWPGEIVFIEVKFRAPLQERSGTAINQRYLQKIRRQRSTFSRRHGAKTPSSARRRCSSGNQASSPGRAWSKSSPTSVRALRPNECG